MDGCDLCTNDVSAERLSTDKQWKYVVFDRNCGATTGSNLQIAVLPASQPLRNESGNAFIADSNRGASPFVAQAEWSSNRNILIRYSSKARIFKKEAKVALVEITYVVE